MSSNNQFLSELALLKNQFEKGDLSRDQYRAELIELLDNVNQLDAEEWKAELTNISEPARLRKTFTNIFEAYLTSPYADDTSERNNAIVLFKHLKKIFY